MSQHKKDHLLANQDLMAVLRDTALKGLDFREVMKNFPMDNQLNMEKYGTVTVRRPADMAAYQNDPLEDAKSRELMIHMRLRTLKLTQDTNNISCPAIPGLKDLHTSYEPTAGKIFIFLVNNGKPVVIEDPASLFPSDALIAQLILLKDAA